jgi:CHAD domain-containing protein
MFDECMQQITANAIALLAGDPAQREVCVHQLRVGIRRLRSGCRSFRGWVEMPPEPLLKSLTQMFQELGRIREQDVWADSLAGVLEQAVMPALVFPAAAQAADPVDLMANRDFQRCLLDALSWRASRPVPIPQGDETKPDAFRRQALKRLKRWHRALLEDGERLRELDEAAFHDLRKRIKRQRYATEFFLPIIGRRAANAYLSQLAPLQDTMGELNDLFSARDACRPLTDGQAAASFAMGWIAARLASTRDDVERAFGKFAKAPAPGG